MVVYTPSNPGEKKKKKPTQKVLCTNTYTHTHKNIHARSLSNFMTEQHFSNNFPTFLST